VNLPNLNFVSLPLLEIIGATQKIWAVPGYARDPFSAIHLPDANPNPNPISPTLNLTVTLKLDRHKFY